MRALRAHASGRPSVVIEGRGARRTARLSLLLQTVPLCPQVFTKGKDHNHTAGRHLHAPQPLAGP